MTQYISKSALVAEIEERLHANGAFNEVGDEAWAEDVGMCNAYKSILSFLDTIETKELDLEKEIDNIWNPRFNLGWDEKSLLSVNHEGFSTIAKHFFELGLKQKGE